MEAIPVNDIIEQSARLHLPPRQGLLSGKDLLLSKEN